MNPAVDALKKLGPIKLAALGGVALVVLIFFGVLISQSGKSSEMQVLYADLDAGDANQIVAQLEMLNIPYMLEENGKTVKVTPDSIGRARITLAEAGLPRGGTMGYELFDKEEGFGTSTFVQNINQVRALEGELARTIASVEQVQSARVHLVLPKRELFSKDKQKPSASVFLKLRGGRKLEKNQIAAIQHLIASAVPDMDVSGISIIDDKGNLVARGEQNRDGDSVALQTSEEARINFENRLRQEIEALVESTVGTGKVRAQVTAQLNFDKVVRNSESFDPDKQAIRSTQTVTENETDNQQDKSVTVQNNLPEAAAGTEGDGSSTSRQSNRNEETVNYEVSKTVENTVRQTGEVKKLSVAVLVDGIYTTNKKGERVYKERTPQELEKFADVIKSAIGYDADRGDTIEVVNMQFADFADAALAEDPSFMESLDMRQYSQLLQTLLMSVVGLLVIVLVVRPVLTRLLEPAPATAGVEATEALLAARGLTPALEAPDGSTLPVPMQEAHSDMDEMLNMAKIDGQIKASSVRKIGDIIDKHPQEALNIIRAWMYEGAPAAAKG